MNEFLRQWIMSLASAAVLSAAAMALTPEGKPKKTVRLVCGIVTVMAMLSPISTLEIPDIGETLERYRDQAQEVSTEMSQVNENMERSLIERNAETYISDKGKNQGLDISSVSVTAKMREDGLYYPYSATVAGNFTEEGRQSLVSIIRDDLGITEGNITWRYDSE